VRAGDGRFHQFGVEERDRSVSERKPTVVNERLTASQFRRSPSVLTPNDTKLKTGLSVCA